MIYGEKLDTFDESRKDLMEFQNATLELFLTLGMLINVPPLYKYFPTKNYRRFVAALNSARQHGEFMVI